MKRVSYSAAILAAFLTACGGGGGSPSAPSPNVSVSISAPSVWQGDTVTLTWSSTNSTSCAGQDSISGIKPISGSEVVTATAAGQLKFTISCDGAGGTFKQTVTLTSNPKTASFASVVAAKSPNADSLGYEPTNKNDVILGEWVYNTGVWGISSAVAYYEKQTGTVNFVDNVASMDLEWDVTASAKPGVVLFGNITYGKHPGWKTSSTVKLPVKLSAMPDMIISGTTKTVCLTLCDWGTSFDIFLMDDESPAGISGSNGTEFMITTEFGGHDIHDTPLGYFTSNGIKFRVYQFKANWNIVVYIPEFADQVSSMNFNLKDFINDAKARGIIKGTEYLNSIEYGTEVAFGKGTTTVTGFSIK